MIYGEIVNYVRKNGGITVPKLQKQFSLGYKEAIDIIAKLVEDKVIEYSSGLDYKVIPPPEKNPFARRRVSGYPARRSVLMGRIDDDDDDDDSSDGDFEEESDESDDDDEESGDDEESSSAPGAVDQTYVDALKLCIQKGIASVSLIQRSMPVGYIKACKIIDWMETMGYITEAYGSRPRKVLLTMQQFRSIFG